MKYSIDLNEINVNVDHYFGGLSTLLTRYMEHQKTKCAVCPNSMSVIHTVLVRGEYFEITIPVCESHDQYFTQHGHEMTQNEYTLYRRACELRGLPVQEKEVVTL